MDSFRAAIFRSAAIELATRHGWVYAPASFSFGISGLQRIKFTKDGWWIWCRDPAGDNSLVIKWNLAPEPKGNRLQFDTLEEALYAAKGLPVKCSLRPAEHVG